LYEDFVNEETDQEWIMKNRPDVYDKIVVDWCDWSKIDWKKHAEEAGRE
jgi:hypothetical protein